MNSRAPSRDAIIRASLGAIRAMAAALIRPPAPEPPKLTMPRAQWFGLPLELRQRWWAETDYGNRPPSRALLADVRRVCA